MATSNVTAIQNAWQPSETQGFGYDSLNRLTTVSGPFAQTFAYDNLGNLTQRDGQTYRYTAGKPHAVSHLGTDSAPRFGYDPTGNMTTRGGQSLVYDAEGRLTSVSGATGTETYAYDGDGALRRRTTAAPTYVPPYTEDFQTANSGWSTSGTVAWGVNPNDGTSHTTTFRATGVSSWTPVIARTATVGNGRVQRVAFKLGQTNSQAGLELDTGSGSGYFRVAVYESGGKLYQALATSTGSGTSYFNPTVLIDNFQANKWYVLELAADDAAGFRVSVWDENVPGVRYEARWEMPTGQPWTFRGWVYTSGTTLWLDTYREEPPSVKTADVRYGGQHYEDDRGPTPSVTKRYYAEGKLLATRTGATLTYVQSDHLGSTSTLTDASGSVIARERYSAFGERRRSDNLALTDQLYTGQQYNSLSGLYHYSDGGSSGRFYDPLLARFVQPDPLLPHLASQGLNRYAPNYNNPLRYKDPDGHDPWDVINGANEFAQGFVSQVGYNNAVFLPPSQAQFAPREGESDAMTAGRVVGDVVSVGQAVVEGSGGAGLRNAHGVCSMLFRTGSYSTL